MIRYFCDRCGKEGEALPMQILWPALDTEGGGRQMVRVRKKTLLQIDWFKSHGYLLGQNKDKFYLIHPQDGKKTFYTVLDAQHYVEYMEAHRNRMS